MNRLNRFFARDITPASVGRWVTVCGWVVASSETQLRIRDFTGLVFCDVSRITSLAAMPILGDVVEVYGLIHADQKEVCIEAVKLMIDNRADGAVPHGEYLRFRTEAFITGLRQQNEMETVTRKFLQANRFLEIRTPMLWQCGQEYGDPVWLVRKSLREKRGYALLQSPMPVNLLAAVGGIERGFQFSQCVRVVGESISSGKYITFTELTLTLTFTTRAEMQRWVEQLIAQVIEQTLQESISLPFPTLSYERAVREYGDSAVDFRYTHYRLIQTDENAILIVPAEIVPSLRAALMHVLTKTYGSQFDFLSMSEANAYFADEPSILAQLATLVAPFTAILLPPDAPGVLLAYLTRFISKHLNLPVPRFGFVWVNDPPIQDEYYSEDPRSSHRHRMIFSRVSDKHLISSDLYLNGINIASGSEIEVSKPKFEQTLKETLPLYSYDYHLHALETGVPPVVNVCIAWEVFLYAILGGESWADWMSFPLDEQGCITLAGISEDL